MERHIFNPNEPTGAMSLMNLRNTLRALFQGDLMPLRPRASMRLDDMEYPSDAAAQAEWSGTGITVGYSTTKQEGNYAIDALIDATGNRILTNSESLNLNAFNSVTIWTRVDKVSSAIKFYLKDSSGNISYWDITTHGTQDTWKQDTLTLASPDSNNGSDADLTDIVEYGFSSLEANQTYIFDTIKAICGMNVAVDYSNIGSFYKQIYVGKQPLEIDRQSSPTLSAPSINPRIDILKINSAGTLAFIAGTEAASPVPDWATLAENEIPICLVYCKTTMVKVVDYEDKDANPNEAYIYADVRPLIKLGILTFLGLTDTPSSFSGEGLKALRVNTGETAIEFFSMLLNLLGDVILTSPSDKQHLEYETSTSKWKNKTPDHGNLNGLGDDDHGQYHNASRHAAISHIESMIGNNAISQAKFKTATGEISTTECNQQSVVTGGTYCFYPQMKVTTTSNICVQIMGHPSSALPVTQTSYTTLIGFSEDGSATLYVQHRYVTTSGQDLWVFLLLDKNIGEIISASAAPDHVSYGNGGDPEKLPHPFGNYDESKHEIVLLDKEICNILEQESKQTDKSILTLVNEEYRPDMAKTESYVPLHSGEFIDTTPVMIETIPDYIKVRKLIKMTPQEKSDKEQAALQKAEQTRIEREVKEVALKTKLNLTDEEFKFLLYQI